jgi:hypothetical protein
VVWNQAAWRAAVEDGIAVFIDYPAAGRKYYWASLNERESG